MKLYNVYYVDEDDSKLFGHMRYETTTDNFEKWLEEHNAQRIEEGNRIEDADEFKVKPISLSLYDETFESIVMSWWDSMPQEMQIEIRKFHGETNEKDSSK
tara:strand:+ start:394 stop:696 length:303 start_codon:yes stop_codon:yes gene_type:complete